ncbi:hypothetical protein LG277_03350 [Vreelandella aquamarina]|uniref:hypothetical protein n=1 Tax=Vreelandella aquamarina TaxID=77097 RepID=UPI00384A7E53
MNSKWWGAKQNLSIDKFLEFNNDGWFEIEEYDGDVEVYVKNIDLLENNKPLLICFTAAVPNREVREYPFFSGIKLSQDLGFPLIAISDPSLKLSKNLNLAWYAGSKHKPYLQRSLSSFLFKLSCKLTVPPLLVGGSGGGYAALSMKAINPSLNANALVWNPQTSITNYYQRFVKAYSKVCFDFDPVSYPSDLKEYLDRVGVSHDISGTCFSGDGKVLYFQNLSDESHLKKHCNLVIERNHYKKIEKKTFDEYVFHGGCIRVGDWSRGHSSIPNDVFLNAVNEIYG